MRSSFSFLFDTESDLESIITVCCSGKNVYLTAEEGANWQSMCKKMM